MGTDDTKKIEDDVNATPLEIAIAAYRHSTPADPERPLYLRAILRRLEADAAKVAERLGMLTAPIGGGQ